jgi:hypothetical protein
MLLRSLLKAAGGKRGYGRLAVLGVLLLVAVALMLPGAALAKGKYGAWVNLRASDPTINSGTSVSLMAKVHPATGSVTLQAHLAGGEWADVATKAVPVSGQVSFTVTPYRHTWYRIVWKRDSMPTTISNVVWVKVFAQIHVYAEPGVYASGQGTPISITGMVIPRFPNGQVFINITVGCMTVAHFPVNLTPGPGDSSVFATTWNALAPGTYKINARVGRTPDFFGANGFTSLTL